MTTTLSVLGRSGDMKLTWDHDDPAERDRIRAEIEILKSAGYSFFLVDGSPADEVAAGRGELIVRRLAAEEVLAPAEPESAAEPQQKRRRRPPKSSRNVVAVRPMAGG